MTDKQKHTPGPWTLFDGKSSSLNGHQLIFGSRKKVEWNTVDLRTGKTAPDNALCGETVAQVYEDTEKFQQWTANALLIASAPELLDMLKELLEVRGMIGHDSVVWDEVRALIVKATGEKWV